MSEREDEPTDAGGEDRSIELPGEPEELSVETEEEVGADTELPESAPVPDDRPPVVFGEVFARFRGLIGDKNGPLFYLWFGVIAVHLTTSLATVYVRDAFDGSVTHIPITVAIGAISTVALFATTASVYAADACGGELSLNEAFEISIEHLVPVTVVATVFHITVWSSAMCLVVPGFVAFFFLYAAPFLAATQGRGVLEALNTSVEWSRKHYVVVLLSIVLAVGTLLGLGLVDFVAFAAIDATFGPSTSSVIGEGTLFRTLLVWGVSAVVGYPAWLWLGALLGTIAGREGVAAPAPAGRDDAPGQEP